MSGFDVPVDTSGDGAETPQAESDGTYGQVNFDNTNGSVTVHFETSGSAAAGHTLASYVLNFGDGTVINMPVGSGSGTLRLAMDHNYTADGNFSVSLTLTDDGGAVTVSQQSILISSVPPNVPSASFNSSTGVLTVTFGEDVGATAANGQYWTDGGFADALDLRNDSTGGSVSVPAGDFTYGPTPGSNTTYTATWNLSGLVDLSGHYTVRLLAADITDAAGNHLDGGMTGFGGNDYLLPNGIGSGALSGSTTLYGPYGAGDTYEWNPALELVTPGDYTVTNITPYGKSPNNTTETEVFMPSSGGPAGGSVVYLQDLPGNFAALDGKYTVQWSYGGYSVIMANSTTYGTYDSTHPGSAITNSTITALESDLHAMTGSYLPTTGKPLASPYTAGLYVGLASDFDTTTPFNKQFDAESQLGGDGYIVRSDGTNLFLVGGGSPGEQYAIGAFLQGLGLEQYGPNAVPKTVYDNIWTVMPNLSASTISGTWDIRGSNSFPYFQYGWSGGSQSSLAEKGAAE